MKNRIFLIALAFAGALLAAPTTVLAQCTGVPAANAVCVGPPSGGSGFPGFRALIGADLPLPTSSTLGGVESFAAVSHQWINQISTGGVPSASQPACGDLSNGAASCSSDTTNAANITSGQLGSVARLPSLNPGQIYQVPASGSAGAPSAQSSRTLLTAPITFFTNADGASSHPCGAFTCSPGSDSNNCLTITTPCQTIQHTVSTEANLFDFAAQAVTFQLAETTYNECVLLPTYVTSTNQGRNVTILGNLSTPANVVVNCGSGVTFTAVNVMYGWIIKGVTLKASTTCLYADHSRLFPDGVAFNACVANDVQAVNSGAFIEFINDNYTSTTSKTCHAQAGNGGEVLWQAVTLTLTGTPAFSTGLECSSNGGVVDDTLLTISGAFTGPKYNISGRMLVFSTGGTSTTQNSTQFIGSSSVSNSEVNFFTIGTLSNKAIQLVVNLGGASPPGGQTMTFTLRLGGGDTALTCQIANPATSCTDLTHSATVTSGTVADIKIVSTATSGGVPVSASVTMQ